MEETTVYLDTNILSRIPDLKVSEETAGALAKLAGLGMVRFVTSQKTKQEILQTPNPHRNSLLQFLHALIEKVQTVPVYFSGAIGGAPIGATPIGGDWTDPTYSKLKSIFDKDDAEHIVQALKAKCDYFMTLDEKTILRRVKANAEEVREICRGMKLLSPTGVVDAIQAKRGN